MPAPSSPCRIRVAAYTMHSPCHESGMGRSARFHEKVYRFEPANAVFLADRLNTFGPPEGAGGPKGLDADDDGGRGRGTGLALGGENHRRRQFASLQAEFRGVGRGPVGGTDCWGRLPMP